MVYKGQVIIKNHYTYGKMNNLCEEYTGAKYVAGKQ